MFSQWSSPQAVFQLLKKLSAGTPCDFAGIQDYRHIDANGGIQWPYENSKLQTPNSSPKSLRGPETSSSKLRSEERRLFADGKFFTPDGKARFIFDLPRPVCELVDDEYPLVLLTGRGTSAQWHTNTRTGKSAVLRTLYPANPYVEINPVDAAQLRVSPNSTVAVVSRRGRVQCTVFISPIVQTGQVFIPMHYGVANQLTRADFDPHSRQPSYKHCAVRLERIK
jgi:assimilatory nitrate reductase catalytic subunit